MRPLRRSILLAPLWLLIAIPAAPAFSLFSGPWADVIVATDTTEEGRKLERPSPGRPVYFRGRSLGARLGSIGGDPAPDEKELTRLVTKVLAQQGYHGATPGVHEPTLFLVVQWGFLHSGSDLTWFLGYDAKQDVAAPMFPGKLGPEVWRRSFRSRTIETILDYASTANYGIIVTAFEYQSARTSKPVIYWQTRIALPANGKSMMEALPAMFLAAGPAIGREADSPALIDANASRDVRIELGELQYKGVVEESAGEPAN